MNREQLRNRISGRIEKVRLEDDSEVFIRRLSALDRARLFDRYKGKTAEEIAGQTREEIVKNECFIVSRGLVLEDGSLVYPDEDPEVISDEIDWESIDLISTRILKISGLSKKEEEEKNSPPTLNVDSSSV
jgi:hypothetical protein